MAYNENLAERIRKALAGQSDIEEKKMMRGLVFMVNGKMYVNAVENELMCRIDPDIYGTALKRAGCRAMVMKGKPLKGYVLVDEKGMATKEDFNYWIQLCLNFNGKAKASKKRKKKSG